MARMTAWFEAELSRALARRERDSDPHVDTADHDVTVPDAPTSRRAEGTDAPTMDTPREGVVGHDPV